MATDNQSLAEILNSSPTTQTFKEASNSSNYLSDNQEVEMHDNKQEQPRNLICNGRFSD